MSELAAAHSRQSVTFLRDTLLPRLARALEILPAEDLWWRPHGGVISVGTILRHLEGNLRQWIVSGLGGAPDHRDRASEFGAPEGGGDGGDGGDGADGADGPTLLARLERTVDEACAVIEGLDGPALLAEHAIQGEAVSGLYALLHVVEHFSWHTGQAVWIAKARAGADHALAFHDEAWVNAAHNEGPGSAG